MFGGFAFHARYVNIVCKGIRQGLPAGWAVRSINAISRKKLCSIRLSRGTTRHCKPVEFRSWVRHPCFAVRANAGENQPDFPPESLLKEKKEAEYQDQCLLAHGQQGVYSSYTLCKLLARKNAIFSRRHGMAKNKNDEHTIDLFTGQTESEKSG